MAKNTQIRDGAVAHIPTQQGDRAFIPDNSISTNKYQDLSITSVKMATNQSLSFASGTAAVPSIRWTSDDDGSGTGFFRPGANIIGFATDGVQRMQVNAVGQVSINTTSADTELNISGVGKATSQWQVGNFGNINPSGWIQNLSDATKSVSLDADPNNVAANSEIQLKVDGTERLKVNAAGVTKASGIFSVGLQTSAATGTQNAFALTSGNVKFTASTTITLNGVVAFANDATGGQILTIINATGNLMTINHESGSATAADRINLPGNMTTLTISNNDTVVLQYDTNSSRWRILSARDKTPTLPSSTAILSGTGATYTTPAGVRWLRIRMVGGGGPGSASGTATGTGGSAATATTWVGSTTSTAGAGSGNEANSTNRGSAAGTASLGAGHIGLAISGGPGAGCQGASVAPTNVLAGGHGGASAFAGGGSTAAGGSGAGGVGAANTGAGGGGGGTTTNAANNFPGVGGGSGGYCDFIIINPEASYTYTVGAGGVAHTTGITAGNAGGNGGSGVIFVEEYY